MRISTNSMVGRVARRAGFGLLVGSVFATWMGCSDSGGTNGGAKRDEFFSQEEWDLIKTFTSTAIPMTPPPSPSNRYADNADAALLGQKLYFEKRISGPVVVADNGANGGLGAAGETGKGACVSCHAPPWFIDTRSQPREVSLGLAYYPANTPTNVDVVFHKWLHWNGLFEAVWSQVLAAAYIPPTVDSNPFRIARVIREHYKADYEKAFGAFPASLTSAPADGAKPPLLDETLANWDVPGTTAAQRDDAMKVWVNFGKAIEAYLRKLVSGKSDFDRYVAEAAASGASTKISESAKRGLRLFIGKAACNGCHLGPRFTDDDFHNIGLPHDVMTSTIPNHVFPTLTPDGRYCTAGNADPNCGLANFATGYAKSIHGSMGIYSDNKNRPLITELKQEDKHKGAFRTPPLRNVAVTEPCYHTGKFPTLESAIDFYNRGGKTMDGRSNAYPKDPKIKELGLTDKEMLDLAAFLRTLTGDQVPEALTRDLSAK